MPSADDRMRAAVDAVFAASDGPATAQAVRGEPAASPDRAFPQVSGYPENQCAGAGLVLW